MLPSAFLIKMLSVLVLALEIMAHTQEATSLAEDQDSDYRLLLPIRSRNTVTHLTTIEKYRCIWSHSQPPLTHIISRPTTPLKFFRHIACADPSMDHSASVSPLPRDWNGRLSWPRQTWLQTVESNVAALNTGLATAQDRQACRCSWSR